MSEPSNLESAFLFYWRALAGGAPWPDREARLNPRRRWRYDLAWREQKLVVELHGAEFQRGRHTRGAGFAKDREKMNWATRNGWRVLEFTTGMLTNNPTDCIAQVVALLIGAEE